MVRQLLRLALAALAFVGGGARLAIGACVDTTPTHISLHAQPQPGSGSPVSVIWGIDNTCGVVETGLLVGTDPAALAPAGQPLYGAQEAYQQDVSPDRPGMYWIGAYARDEAGNRIEAVPQMVVVGPTSTGAAESEDSPPGAFAVQAVQEGTFAVQATYFGDDRDFLVATGNPHVASVKSRDLTQYSEIVRERSLFWWEDGRTLVSSRWVSGTSRQEVIAGFQEPFVIEGRTYPVNAFALAQALNLIDSQFSGLGYPRSGLYTVWCRQLEFFELGSTQIRGTFSGCQAVHASSPSALSYSDGSVRETRSWPDGQIITTHSSVRSRVTLFVPAAPSGERVQKAILRVRLKGGGSAEQLQQVRLNGKAPIAFNMVSCFAVWACAADADWDFTAEAQPLAAQGGGLLSIVADPIPHRVVDEGGPCCWFTGSQAQYSMDLALNYPWRPGAPDGALSIWFEPDDCPRQLELVLSAGTVRPDMPARQADFAGISRLGTHSIVTAQVTDCPTDGQPPVPVDITLAVYPPVQRTAEDGGHLHSSASRTTGAFDGKEVLTTCRIESQDFSPEGRGECSVTYFASSISGTETIVATAPGFPEASAKITVRVNELSGSPLSTLAANSNYVLVGAPSSADPCPRNVTSQHEQNHFGRTRLHGVVAAIASEFLEETGILLRVNDMSLPLGGRFDVGNNWTTPHGTHRTGRDVDVGVQGVRDGACVDFSQAPDQLELLRRLVRRETGQEPTAEGNPINHFHGTIVR